MFACANERHEAESVPRKLGQMRLTNGARNSRGVLTLKIYRLIPRTRDNAGQAR
jgi:hypothetical protein